MNAHKFVADFGIERAKAVLEGAPDWAVFWISRDQYHCSVMSFPNMTGHYSIDLSELKQVVESIENIEFYGGFAEVEFKIKRAEFNGWFCISVPHEDGFAEWYVENAKKAISDYELVGSYKENQHV